MTTTNDCLPDPLAAGAAVLVHNPQREAERLAEAYAEGEVSARELLRQLHTLLRSVDAVLKPLQEARDTIREAMEKPVRAAGGTVELAADAVVTWVEPIITESYERGKVDQLVAELVSQGGPMVAVAAQLAALKKQSTRVGFVKVERLRHKEQPTEEPPF